MGKKKKFDVAPYIVKQSSQDGKYKTEDTGFGADIYTKYGTFGISKNENTQSFNGGNQLKTKSKNINYGKNFKINDSTNVSVEANYGKAENTFSDRTTKGGKITLTKSFSRGGGVAIQGTKFNGVK